LAISLVLGACWLTACASQAERQAKQERERQEEADPMALRRLLGQPLDVAVGILGYPSDQREVLGDKVYTWRTNAGVFNAPCQIELGVRDGVIRHFDWTGGWGGCSIYQNELLRANGLPDK
jgi:hypothetical protein